MERRRKVRVEASALRREARTFAYDALGRLTSATNPEQTKPTAYTYDADNDIQTRTDALGVTTTYNYDYLDRLTGKTYSDGVTPNVTYTWDGAGVANGVGRLASVSNKWAVRNYTAYDSVGHVTASSEQNLLNGQTYTFNNYSYDLAGSLTSETYPSGRVITTAYDGAERPTGVTGQPSGGLATNYVSPLAGNQEYWPHGALYAYQYANSVVPVTTFDKVLRPAANWATVNNSANNYLLLLENSWNPNGTLAWTVEGYGPNVPWGSMNFFTQNYVYDGLNRLTSACDVGYSRGFSYDAYGNMSVASASGAPLNGITPSSANGYNPYNPATNQLLNASYDANGQMKALGNPTAVTFAYDAEGRVTSSVSMGSPSVTVNYYYDGEGNRVQKSVAGGTTTAFVHDAFGALVAEYASAAITPLA